MQLTSPGCYPAWHSTTDIHHHGLIPRLLVAEVKQAPLQSSMCAQTEAVSMLQMISKRHPTAKMPVSE